MVQTIQLLLAQLNLNRTFRTISKKSLFYFLYYSNIYIYNNKSANVKPFYESYLEDDRGRNDLFVNMIIITTRSPQETCLEIKEKIYRNNHFLAGFEVVAFSDKRIVSSSLNLSISSLFRPW